MTLFELDGSTAIPIEYHPCPELKSLLPEAAGGDVAVAAQLAPPSVDF